MTAQISITLTILILAAILFISGRLRVDLVALLVLGSLALTGWSLRLKPWPASAARPW